MITSVARQLKLKFFAPLGKIFGFAEAWFHNAGNPFVKRAFLLDGGIVSGLGDETEYFVDDINMLVASNNVDFVRCGRLCSNDSSLTGQRENGRLGYLRR